MRRTLAFIFFLLSAGSSYGQNMVLNPSFEQYYQCPTNPSSLNSSYLPNWVKGNNQGVDYYNCTTGNYGVPGNAGRYQQAFHGHAYAGFVGYYVPQGMQDTREYIKGNLNPLIPNTAYAVTVHLNLSNGSMVAISSIGVYFYQNGYPLNTNANYYLALTPQIDYSQYGPFTDTANWITVIDTFFADSAYTNFLIGNFLSGNNTNYVSQQLGGGYNAAEYYVDSVIVVPVTLVPLTATTTQVNELCNGGNTGTATVTPIGGLSPYTYLWSNGQTTQTATGLVSGAYTCTVTDALNNTYSVNVTIAQPPAMMLSVTSSTLATCGQQNGSISVTTILGTPGYTYSWSPYGGTGSTANNLGGGTYTCTVTDANGCIATIATSLNTTNAFTLSTSATNALCYGTSSGSATATPLGGTQPFTYLWSNGQTTQTATGLAAGTYSVTATDANGCTNTATITITQPTLLTASISGSTNVDCFGQSTGTATVSASGGTPGYTYLWSNGQTTATATGLAAGTYFVTVTDSKGCVTTASVNIIQSPQLNLNVVSTTNTSCAQSNGAATVVASGGTPGYTYQWLPTGGTGTSASGLGAGIYTVTVTDTKGCTKTVNIIITTSTPLNVTLTSSTNVLCNGGNNGAASVNVTGGTQPYTYQWSNGQTTPSVTGLIAGTYSVVVTDVNGCAGSATVIIAQPSALSLIIASQTNINCYGQSTGSLSTAVSGGTTPYTYLWSNGSTSPSIGGLAAGTYTCTVTDAHGCTSIVTATVTQNPALNVAINPVANATCSQNNGWATASVSGGTPPYTYNWSNLQNTQTATNLGAGTYTCNVTDALGCTGSATINITQSAALTLNIVSSNISCNGLTDGTATVTVSTGTQPYTYNWSNGGTTASIYNLSAGTYTINITDAIGCAGSASVTITQPTALTASILSSTNPLCNGASTGSAEATATGGTSPYAYLWSNSNTTAIQNSLGAGTYTVVVTDSNGCTANATVTINEPNAILLNAQATASSCAGEDQGVATASVSGGIPPYTYSWNSNPIQTTANAGNLAAGSYIVTVTDSSGCVATASVSIIAFPAAAVDAGDDVLYCYDKETVTLHATGADSYVWSPAYGLSCTACPDPVATPAITTVYTVTGTDANGCTATDMVTVSVLTKQPVSIGSTKDICTGESVQLFATGGSEYSWSPAEGMNDSHIAEPVVTPAQTTEYTVFIKQNDCFSDTLTQLVNVYLQPTVSLGPDLNSSAGASTELHADTSNATSIAWTPPFNLSCDNCTNPVALIEKDIRYVVTVTNGGCTAMDDINIKLSCSEKDIFFANTFTPNNDHNNDYFYPQSAYSLPIVYMAVYDRWGEKIFEQENFRTNDPKKGWDGTYKGKLLDPAVYVYYLQFLCGNGQKVLVKGDVSIVK